MKILKGNLVSAPALGKLEIVEHGCLVLHDDGSIQSVEKAVPQSADAEVIDYGDSLIMPSFVDMHLHAPQYPMLGMGMDLPLIDWLNTYTFPEESKYQDLEYAHRAYASFTEHLLRSTTTRAAVFATIHVPATLHLMELLENSGLRTYVGKVNMNRNCPVYLREISKNQAVRDTAAWLEAAQKFERTKPILTPRFIPSCTDDLMYALSGLRRQYDVPVQSHLSENFSEIAWVQELCPRSKCYGDAYRQFGLFGGDHRCIMAHCVHSGELEQEMMKENGVFIAHSPESNMNLSSGVAPVSKFLENGLKVGLATDVAGGSHESILRAMMHAIQASKLRWRLQDQSVPALSFERAFYLATAGGGEFFGKVGAFREGYEADAVVMDDSGLDHPQALSVRARLERLVYLADERCVREKYVAGERVL